MAFTALIAPIYNNVKQYGAAGDGVTNDTTAIQAAISALPSGGGGIFFPPGTYSLATDVIIPSNVHVQGAGRGSILLAAASSSTNCLNLSGSSHVTVSDLQINGNKLNVTQLSIQYTALSGIYIHNSDDITITRCYIHDCYVSGIMANGGSTNIMISNCRMVNNYDNQIYIRAQDTTPYTPCTYGTVTGCVCSGGSFSGIQVLGSSYYAITGNTCYSNGPTSAQGDGIGSEGASYLTITGNTVYNNGIQGIHIRFTNEVGAAQISSHIVVSGNVSYNHTSTNGDAGGIAVDDTTDVVVSNNLVTGNAFGINVNGGNGNGVNNCVIVGNTVRNNSNLGIRVQPTAGVEFLIEENYIADNANDNILVNGALAIIRNNIIARATGTHSGIHLQTGSSNSLIDGCSIYDNTDNGIVIDSPVSGVDIRNCYFNNIVGTNQNRALQEQSGAGPTKMVNCRILNQHSNNYVFNHAQSRYFDEETLGIVTVTSTYTVLASDDTILCNQSAAMTVTLPNPSGLNGRTVTIVDRSGTAVTNPITVNAASGNVNGVTSKVINTAYGSMTVTNDGSNWYTASALPAGPQLALYDGEIAQTSSSAGVANTVYFIGVYLQGTATLTNMRIRFASGGAGHYDLGIYDASGTNGAPGNLLAHAAATSTTLATSSATLSPAMISSVALGPGRYWLALWIDNATDTFNKQSASGSNAVIISGSNAGPLPALASSVTSQVNATLKPIVIGLLSGGWS